MTTESTYISNLEPYGETPVLSVRNISKRFGSQVVLDDVSFDVPEGKITFVLGPSGTGKSVLLKIIIGLLQPDAGRVLIDSYDIPSLSSHQLNEVRKDFGVLFQNGALFDSLNVLENVAFPLVEHAKMAKGDIADRVEKKLAQVGLSGVEKKYPSELSGGMRKRAALARAIVLDPRIIFYDEPTTGLDPLMVEQVDELIKSTNIAQQTTSLVISHDIPALMEIADYGAILFEGSMVAFGTPAELLENPDPFVQKFLRKGLGEHV